MASRIPSLIPIAGSIVFWVAALGNGESVSLFRVHIVSPEHENVTKAKIEISSGQESRTVFTDADGMATFAKLSSGEYKIRIEAYGFKTWTENEGITAEQERPLLVTLQWPVLACGPVAQIEYNNEPGPTVRGRIVDSISGRGHGIRGMRIEWRSPGEKKPMRTVYSMKKGSFEVLNIPPGRYRLRVTDEGYTVLDKIHQDVEVDIVVPRQDNLFITIKVLRMGYVELCS